MKKTTNLQLPIYDTPLVDKFKLTDWNTANQKLEETYVDIGNKYKDTLALSATSASLEIVDARNGAASLGAKVRGIDSSLNELDTHTIGWVNVESFPKISGEVNDSDRIQRAINYASANSIYNVLLPRTMYTIDKPILIKSKIRLTGNGLNSTVLKAVSTLSNILNFENSNYTTDTGIEISNLFLDCNNLADYGIYIDGSIREHLISRLQIQNAKVCGIKGLVVYSVTIEKCIIIKCPKGIEFIGAANDLVIQDNDILSSTIVGINIESTTSNSSGGNIISGNAIQSSTVGIRLYNIGNQLGPITITGNYMEANNTSIVCASAPQPDTTKQQNINIISNKLLAKSTTEYNIDLIDARIQSMNIIGNWLAGVSIAYIRTPADNSFSHCNITGNYKNNASYPLVTSAGGFYSIIEEHGQYISKPTFKVGMNIENTELASATGTVVRKIPIYSTANGLLGYIPIYNSIT